MIKYVPDSVTEALARNADAKRQLLHKTNRAVTDLKIMSAFDQFGMIIERRRGKNG